MKQRNMLRLVLGIFFIVEFVLDLTAPSYVKSIQTNTNLGFGIGLLASWWFVPKTPKNSN